MQKHNNTLQMVIRSWGGGVQCMHTPHSTCTFSVKSLIFHYRTAQYQLQNT